MMYQYGYGPDYGWGAFGIFWHIIGLLIVIAAIICLVRMIAWGGRRNRWHGMHGHPWWDRSGSALEILAERYAKGEISKEEYEERKKTLMS